MADDYSFNTFWETYPLDLCTRRGSKTQAQKAWDKKDEKTQRQIIINMRELIRSDRDLKKRGQFVSRWPYASTFLNQDRHEDVQDIQEYTSRAKPVTKLCDCGNKAAWQSLCWECYDKAHPDKCMFPMQELKDKFIKIGLYHDESKAERTQRCKQYAVPRIRALAGRN